MKIIASLMIVFLLIWSFQACDPNTKSSNAGENNVNINDTTINVGDEISEFLVKAASGSMMEVQLGEMAEQNSKSEGVRNFGKMMIKDHSKANTEIKTLAASKDIPLPDVITQDHEKHINNLTPLRGGEFDENYMQMMIQDHQEDIDLFEKAATYNDPDISAFANKTLPVLKKHLNAAYKIRDGLKN